MRRFLRRPRLPSWVADAVSGHGETVLASAEVSDGSWLVGTHRHLYAVSPAEPQGAAPEAATRVTRLPWEGIRRSTWDRDTSTLRVEPVEPVQPYNGLVPSSGTSTAWTCVIEEPGLLLGLVRDRVTASVLLQRRVALRGKRGFTVIARRPPSGGPVTWTCEYDDGVDPTEPSVAEAVEAALASARAELGSA